MQRHAYLLLVHTNPEQVKKLLSLLDNDKNGIFVHIDKSSSVKRSDFEGVCRRSELRFVPEITVSWGGVSIMHAELSLLRCAVEAGYDYYHLLSGMDLPIKSQEEMHRFFEMNAGKEFFTMWPANSQTHDSFHYRTILPECNRFILAKKLKLIHRNMLKLLDIRMNKDIEESFASQWFSITHDFASYVLENEEWLRETFKYTGQTDELFLATMLKRSPFAKNLYDPAEYVEKDGTHGKGSMRFIDWSGNGHLRHPKTLRIEDYDRLMASDAFWARKFNEKIDKKIIDRIYARLSDSGAHQPGPVEKTARQS